MLGVPLVVTGRAEPSNFKRLAVIVVVSVEPFGVLATLGLTHFGLDQPPIPNRVCDHIMRTVLDRVFLDVPLSIFCGLAVTPLLVISSIIFDVVISVLPYISLIAGLAFIYPAIGHLRVPVKIC